MEQPWAKRRKTSPSTSIAVNTETKSKHHNGVRNSARRASFMSPTKASLAKFNPNLLDKTASEPRRQSGRTNGSFGKSPLTNTPSQGPKRARYTPSNTAPNKISVALGTDSVKTRNSSNGVSITPQQRSQTSHSQIDSPTRHLNEPARDSSQSPAKAVPASAQSSQQNPIAHQNDQAHDGVLNEEIGIDLFSVEKLPYTPTRRGLPTGHAQDENEEPSLPSTPSQLGLEAPPAAPRGLLFGTPSKRLRKKKPFSPKIPSPLKAQVNSANKIHEGIKPTASLGPRIYLPYLPKPAPNEKQAELREKRDELVKIERELVDLELYILKTNLFSHWRRLGPKEKKDFAKRRKHMTNALNRLVQLREDLENLEIIEDIREDLDSDLGTSRHPSEMDTLISRLSHFMPFSGSSIRESPSHEKSSIGVDEITEPERDLTPFHVEIHGSHLLPTTTQGVIPQRHELRISFPSLPDHILNLRLTIDSKAQLIMASDVRTIWLTQDTELSDYLRNRTRGKDLTTLGRALGRWYNVAQLRSQCWNTCQETFPHLLPIVPPDQARQNMNEAESLLLQDRHGDVSVSLTVSWKITINDTDGEVESRVFAFPQFPPSWARDDRIGIESRQALGRIGEAFDLLVREHGVTAAMGVILKAVFPQMNSDKEK